MAMTSESRDPQATRAPRASCVVPHEEAAALVVPIDWSAWYLTHEEDMCESPEQAEIIELLKDVLKTFAASGAWGEGHYIGGDAFFAWVEAHPLVRVSPDVYVLERQPPDPLPGSFQIWREGHERPTLAVEVVSDDWKKDYELNPHKYALLGVKELVIFDPRPAAAGDDPDAPRVRLQVFRWTEDGNFVGDYRGPGPVALETVPAELVVVPTPRGVRLRLAREDGLLPTALEVAASERARADDERANAAAERARADDALRRLAELEARLAEQR